MSRGWAGWPKTYPAPGIFVLYSLQLHCCCKLGEAATFPHGRQKKRSCKSMDIHVSLVIHEFKRNDLVQKQVSGVAKRNSEFT